MSSIGIFDSGFGGLTVMRAIIRALPHENIIYLADTARLPYGDKSKQTIVRYAKENADFLINRGVKLLVVACATVCSSALDVLQVSCPLPVVGVMPIAREDLFLLPKTGRMALLATTTTIQCGVYERHLRNLLPHVEIESIACPLLVPLIEKGFIDHPLTLSAVKKTLKSLKQRKIGSLILGCTHFPLIAKVIQQVIGEDVTLIDPAQCCAKKIQRLLDEMSGHHTQQQFPRYEFYVTDNPEKFYLLGKDFLERPISHIEKVGISSLK